MKGVIQHMDKDSDTFLQNLNQHRYQKLIDISFENLLEIGKRIWGQLVLKGLCTKNNA